MGKTLLITQDSRVVNLKDDGSWKYVTPSHSSLDTWQGIEQTSTTLGFFQGLFDRVGVRVLDTKEEFTCVQNYTGIEFIDGLDENSVDYTVQIYSYQAERLAGYLQTGDIEEIEQYRIVRSLYAPIASAAFKNTTVIRFMNNSLISLLINRKRVVHIDLLSPDRRQENDANFTMLGVSKQWLMLEGHHGTPYRVLRVTHLDVLDMYKHVTATMRTRGWIRWVRLTMWYLGWRKKVQKDINHCLYDTVVNT